MQAMFRSRLATGSMWNSAIQSYSKTQSCLRHYKTFLPLKENEHRLFITPFPSYTGSTFNNVACIIRTPKPLDTVNVKASTTVAKNQSTLLSAKYGGFHVSSQRQFHPLVWMIAKPVAKIASIIGGRRFRNWWQTLSSTDKLKYKEKLRENRYKIAALGGLLVASLVGNYFYHLQDAPVTGRSRYIAFTPQQFLKIAKFNLEIEWELVKDEVVAPTDPAYKRVVNVAQRLVNANQDFDLLKKQIWNVVVVDNADMNAFVLPTGHIFVFTGLLKCVTNDDQLAVILGHEIAHVLCSHGAEKVSFAHGLDLFIILAMAFLWAFVPSDGIALVTQWFYNKVVQLLLELPYSRKLEREADEVGLHLAAKACYDVRESSTFWGKFALADESGSGEKSMEWLSTHPAHENRVENLDAIIPELLKLREGCNCPKLGKDPRDQVKFLKEIINSTKKVVMDQQPLPTVSTSPAAAAAVAPGRFTKNTSSK